MNDYYSRLSKIDQFPSEAFEIQGTLRDILNPKSDLDVFLYPFKFMNTILSYKEKCPQNRDVFNLVRDSVGHCTDILLNNVSDDNMQQKLSSMGFLDKPLCDLIFWKGGFYEHFHERLNKNMQEIEKDFLFIPLARKGLISGLDLYLRMGDIGDSIFHPIRYTTKSSKDKTPRCTSLDLEFMAESFKGRHLVVYDNDICTGETMFNFLEYLNKEISLDNVTVVTLYCKAYAVNVLEKTQYRINLISPFE